MTPGGGSDVNDGCGFSEVRGVIQFLTLYSRMTLQSVTNITAVNDE